MFKMNKNEMTYRRKNKLCRRKTKYDLSFFHISSEQVREYLPKSEEKCASRIIFQVKLSLKYKSKPFSFIHESKEQSTQVFFPKKPLENVTEQMTN